MYKFYNQGNNIVLPKKEFRKYIKDQFDCYDVFRRCWCVETCAPRLREIWDAKNNYTAGQCSITALIVQEYFGGDIYAIDTDNGGSHSYNVVEGKVFDLTSEQFFDKKLDYSKGYKSDISIALLSEEKYQRYSLLKQRFEEELGIR